MIYRADRVVLSRRVVVDCGVSLMSVLDTKHKLATLSRSVWLCICVNGSCGCLADDCDGTRVLRPCETRVRRPGNKGCHRHALVAALIKRPLSSASTLILVEKSLNASYTAFHIQYS